MVRCGNVGCGKARWSKACQMNGEERAVTVG